MPELILAPSKYFHKLFENSSLATITPLRKANRVMIMTVYLVFVLIVAVLRAKRNGTYRAREVVDVVLAVQCCDIGAP